MEVSAGLREGKDDTIAMSLLVLNKKGGMDLRGES